MNPDIEDVVDEIFEKITDVADNTDRFTRQESLEIYQGLISCCQTMVRALEEN